MALLSAGANILARSGWVLAGIIYITLRWAGGGLCWKVSQVGAALDIFHNSCGKAGGSGFLPRDRSGQGNNS